MSTPDFKKDINNKIAGIKSNNDQILARRRRYPSAAKAFGIALTAIRGTDSRDYQIDGLLKSYDNMIENGFSKTEALEASVWLWSESGLYIDNAAITAAIGKALKELA